MSINKLFISFLFVLQIAISQINIRSIESFSIEDGLSQASVYSIFQDSRGLLWLGTEGGINKYDGYSIISFPTIDSKKILSSTGAISSIIEDHESNLWYGSLGILSRLNIHSEKPDNLNSLLKNSDDIEIGAVSSVFEDSKKNIWFGTSGQGFFKVYNDIGEIKNYRNDPDSTGDSSYDYVQDFYEDESGILWIATFKGLVKFEPVTEVITNIFGNIDGFTHVVIHKIIPREKWLLLFTGSHGILLYDTEIGELKEYNSAINDLLKNYSLRDAVLDKENNLWVCAFGGGIFVVNNNGNSIHSLADELNDNYYTLLREPLSICIDRIGIVWIGTQRNGLFKVITGNKKINSINSSKSGYEKIDNFFATSVARNDLGDIWFASGSGLFKINSKTKKIDKLSLSKEFSPYMMRIYNIIFKNNFAWLSMGQFLVKYNLVVDRYEKIPFETEGNLTEIHHLSKDELIIGTSLGEIFIYNMTKNEIKKSAVINQRTLHTTIVDFQLDELNILWIGTNNGLYKGDFSDDSLSVAQVPLNLNIDYISSLAGSKDGKLWFTTYGDGLYALDKLNMSLEHFSHQDGLPDNILYAAMFDDKNRLWMSSNRGIFEFDLTNRVVRTLDIKDGIQSYEYNSKAFSKSSDGELFFGGINGFDYFYPQEIEINTIPPKMLIDKVVLYDSIIINNITKDFNRTLEFNYNENSISFEFSALDFTNPLKNNYEYKLEGINNSWIKAGTKRYATFPNINPGTYTFTVRGSNSDQIFNEEGVSVAFIIYPPFWATWWFRTLLSFSFLALVFFLYMMRIKNQERRIKEIEAIRKNIADDFHDDLGHKLTRISLYSEMIRNQEQFGTNKQVYLDKINDAANSLFYETKDFIWSLDPGNDSVYDVLVYLKDFGDDFFSRSGIAFKVESIDEIFKMYSLPMKWKREIILIFKEGMNNIIKHSGATYTELKAILNENTFTLSLCDNGKGFEVNGNKLKGRGLTSIEKRTSVINGNLEIISNENGTTIKLSLNLDGVKK